MLSMHLHSTNIVNRLVRLCGSYRTTQRMIQPTSFNAVGFRGVEDIASITNYER